MLLNNLFYNVKLSFSMYFYLIYFGVCFIFVSSSEVDLDACLNAFDIHQDKIIRTDDSTALGAQYLDESDLPTRADCLKLCCETLKCDVFVYEEKSPGSCYMFHCGPPEDFRCKFTGHANYSSAVLAVTRNTVAASSVIQSGAPQPFSRLSQHEMQLANLRGRPVPIENSPVTTKPVLATKLPPPTTTPYRLATSVPHCSRFQFSCHSGECIAVYNACDGIPQCVDGSDEAPELGCPASPNPTTQAPPPQPPAMPAERPVVLTPPREPIIQQGSLREMLPMPNQKTVPLSRGYGQLEGPVIPDSKQIADSLRMRQNWVPHQSNEQYESDSHIFNHKGGLQLASSPYVDAPVDLDRTGDYRQAGDIYRVRQPPSWQPDHISSKQVMPDTQDWVNRQPPQLMPPMRQFPQQEPPQLQWHPDWPVSSMNQWPPQQQGPIIQETPVVVQQNPIQQPIQQSVQSIITKPKEQIAKVQPTEKPDSEEYVDDSEEESSTPPTKSSANTKKGKHKHHKGEQHHERDGHDHSHDHVENTNKSNDNPKHLHLGSDVIATEIDGPAERPGGAVLSLTLGVCITAALAVLAGCRLRAVRRRVRRTGKSSGAHAADYLVNGMYL